MKILMISDFHFKGTENTNQAEDLASKMCDIVLQSLSENEELFVINLGDIIDKGGLDGYSNAIIIYEDVFKKRFPLDTHYIFVPGNHDLKTENDKDGNQADDNFCHFDDFAQKYSDKSYRFSSKTAHHICYDEIEFILANSVFEKDIAYASLDASRLYDFCNHKALRYPLFVAHHDIVGHHDQPYDKDSRTVFVSNQTEFQDIAKHCNINYYLHGHTHIFPERIHYVFEIESIGVGPAFDMNYSDGPQFNLITYHNRKIVECYNYSYIEFTGSYQKTTMCKAELPSAVEYALPGNYLNRKVIPSTRKTRRKFQWKIFVS